jgi:predicted phage terminase large subunit-like protein
VVRNKKPLWPGKYKNMQAIKTEEKRIGNPIAWEREFMLRIVPDDGQVVHREWIQYYDEPPRSNDADPDEGGISFRQCAIGVDLAISQKQTADYTAMVPAKVYLIGHKAFVYILPEIVNRRMDFSTSQETLKALAETIYDSPKSVKMYIEGVGYQQAFIQETKHQGYSTVDVQPRGDKRSRLSTSSHYIKTGRVLFPKKGCERLIEQMTGFGVEKHDDMVDAFTTLVNEVMKDPPRRHFFAFIGGDDDEIHWF